MKFVMLFLLAAASAGNTLAAEAPKVLPKVEPLPLALSDDFQFRKNKTFFASEALPKRRKNMFTSTKTRASLKHR